MNVLLWSQHLSSIIFQYAPNIHTIGQLYVPGAIGLAAAQWCHLKVHRNIIHIHVNPRHLFCADYLGF